MRQALNQKGWLSFNSTTIITPVGTACQEGEYCGMCCLMLGKATNGFSPLAVYIAFTCTVKANQWEGCTQLCEGWLCYVWSSWCHQQKNIMIGLWWVLEDNGNILYSLRHLWDTSQSSMYSNFLLIICVLRERHFPPMEDNSLLFYFAITYYLLGFYRDLEN